jgi:outer membrane protein assembly factor BamB
MPIRHQTVLLYSILGLSLGIVAVLPPERAASADEMHGLPPPPGVASPGPLTNEKPAMLVEQQFRRGLSNNDIVPFPGAPAWAADFPGSVRGTAFAADAMYLATESRDGVTSVNPRTGAVLWFAPTPSWVHGDPVMTSQLVIATYGHVPMADPVGGVVGINRATGRERWRTPFSAGVMPAPALRDDTVFVLAGDGCSTALDARTGARLWRRCFASPFAMSSPRLSGDALYGGATDGSLYEWNAKSGEAIWRFKDLEVPRVGDVPVAIGDSLLFTTGVRPVEGRTSLGEVPLRSIVATSFELLGEGRIRPALGLRFTEHFALAVRLSDGREKWRTSLGLGMTVARNTSGTPVIVGDALFVASPIMRSLYRLDANTGELVWRRRLGAVTRGAVTIVNQRVYLVAEDATLRSFDARTGDALGSCRLSSASSPFAPVVVGASLFFGDRSGRATMMPLAALNGIMRRRLAESCAVVFERFSPHPSPSTSPQHLRPSLRTSP